MTQELIDKLILHYEESIEELCNKEFNMYILSVRGIDFGICRCANQIF